MKKLIIKYDENNLEELLTKLILFKNGKNFKTTGNRVIGIYYKNRSEKKAKLIQMINNIKSQISYNTVKDYSVDLGRTTNSFGFTTINNTYTPNTFQTGDIIFAQDEFDPYDSIYIIKRKNGIYTAMCPLVESIHFSSFIKEKAIDLTRHGIDVYLKTYPNIFSEIEKIECLE